jgi:hypothetical protein
MLSTGSRRTACPAGDPSPEGDPQAPGELEPRPPWPPQGPTGGSRRAALERSSLPPACLWDPRTLQGPPGGGCPAPSAPCAGPSTGCTRCRPGLPTSRQPTSPTSSSTSVPPPTLAASTHTGSPLPAAGEGAGAAVSPAQHHKQGVASRLHGARCTLVQAASKVASQGGGSHAQPCSCPPVTGGIPPLTCGGR